MEEHSSIFTQKKNRLKMKWTKAQLIAVLNETIVEAIHFEQTVNGPCLLCAWFKISL